MDAATVAAMANPETVQRISDETEARMASEEIQNRIESKVQDALKVAVGLEITKQTERVEADVAAKAEEQLKLPENQAIIEQHTDELMNEAVAKALKQELINNIIMQQAEEGVKQLTEALANLNVYAEFYYGLKTYTAGISTAAQGVSTLYSNMPELVSGISQLRDGGKMLYDGVIRFDKEGISYITNALDGEVGELRDRMKASYDAAKDYRGVSGLPEGMPCISFVYRGASIDND